MHQLWAKSYPCEVVGDFTRRRVPVLAQHRDEVLRLCGPELDALVELRAQRLDGVEVVEVSTVQVGPKTGWRFRFLSLWVTVTAASGGCTLLTPASGGCTLPPTLLCNFISLCTHPRQSALQHLRSMSSQMEWRRSFLLAVLLNSRVFSPRDIRVYLRLSLMNRCSFSMSTYASRSATGAQSAVLQRRPRATKT